jgi:hypothetical protein
MCSTGRSPRRKGSSPGRMLMAITMGATVDVPIPRTSVINGDSVATLKQGRICGGTSLGDRKRFKNRYIEGFDPVERFFPRGQGEAY